MAARQLEDGLTDMLNWDELQPRVSLEGKTAIITGASRPNGMGRAIARALAIRGAKIIVTDIG